MIPARRLKVGERYRLVGRVYRVVLVNACRARLELCGGERITRELRARGETVRFETWEGPRHLDVSPYSIMERIDGD